MERIGIYCSSFQPPRMDRLAKASEAAKRLGLNRLILLPLPGRKDPGAPEFCQQMEMLRMAAKTVDSCTVTTEEAGLAEAAERIETECPGGKLFLLTEPWDEDKIEPLSAHWHRQVLPQDEEVPQEQLRRLAAFRCARPLLPGAIADYIEENRLYGFSEEYQHLPMERLEQVVVSLLKPNRVAHVLGCRDTAVKLAKRWGADEVDASRAGILHDITKALDGPLQLTLCRGYGILLDAFSTQNPKTLHALTGSLVADRVFGENPAVVEAIRYHTTGKADMNLLEKIIYVADYMEPNRDFPGVEKLRQLAFEDIDEALKLGLTMTMDLLHRQNRQISNESLEALAWLERSK